MTLSSFKMIKNNNSLFSAQNRDFKQTKNPLFIREGFYILIIQLFAPVFDMP